VGRKRERTPKGRDKLRMDQEKRESRGFGLRLIGQVQKNYWRKHGGLELDTLGFWKSPEMTNGGRGTEGIR